jgi:hypothetical protein
VSLTQKIQKHCHSGNYWTKKERMSPLPGHMEIPGNEIAEEEAKAVLEDDLLATEKYPPQDLINWIKTEDKKTRKARLQNSENNMKNRKIEIEWNKDRKKMKKQDQVVISKLRTG